MPQAEVPHVTPTTPAAQVPTAPAAPPHDPPGPPTHDAVSLWESIGLDVPDAIGSVNVRTASGDIAGALEVVMGNAEAPLALVIVSEDGLRHIIPWHACRSINHFNKEPGS